MYPIAFRSVQIPNNVVVFRVRLNGRMVGHSEVWPDHFEALTSLPFGAR